MSTCGKPAAIGGIYGVFMGRNTLFDYLLKCGLIGLKVFFGAEGLN